MPSGIVESTAPGGQSGRLYAGGGCPEWLGEKGSGEGKHSAHFRHNRESASSSEQVERSWTIHPAKTQ